MKISKLLGVACGAGLLFGPKVALADISIGDSGATVDFTGFTGGGFTSSPGAGQLDSDDWAISGFSNGDLNFGGTNTSDGYMRKPATMGAGAGGPATTGAPAGSTNPGPGIYDFYVDQATDNYFLGVFSSTDDFTPGTITARFKNTRAKSIVSMTVAFRVLTWNNTTHTNTLTAHYSTDNATWVDLQLSQSTNGPVDASLSWDSFQKSKPITVTIPVNGNFYLRWTGSDTMSGDGDSMGIDDIVLTPQNGCGDGVAAGAEECDDGNTVNTDACTNACTQAVCGDDIVRTTVEQCDGTVCCGAPNTANECKRLTGTICPGGTCNNGTCVSNGQAGDTGMAGDDGLGGDNGLGGDGAVGGEAGASQGGIGGRGGRGGMAGTEMAGTSGGGTAGTDAAGTAGTTAGSGNAGTAGTTANGGAGTGGSGGTSGAGKAGSGGNGGKAGASTGGSGAKHSGGSGGSSDDDSGCGCSVPRGNSHGTLALVAAGALVTLMRRRRKNR
jgi:cysteine-rich repeat protein